jgi:hypothetical protein
MYRRRFLSRVFKRAVFAVFDNLAVVLCPACNSWYQPGCGKVRPRASVARGPLERDCRPRGAHHQHATSLPYLDGFVVDVHPYRRVGSQLLCFRDHLSNGGLPRLPQGPLVTGRAAAYYVPQAPEQVPEDVGPQTASPVTTPKYSITGWPSIAVVVLTIIKDLLAFPARLLGRGL